MCISTQRQPLEHDCGGNRKTPWELLCQEECGHEISIVRGRDKFSPKLKQFTKGSMASEWVSF